mgnify:CR=1 FL=1
MARPSQDVDKELLRVGRELYPALGCTGLSVRRVALEAGWILTEVGRQPWIIYGVLRTADAATGEYPGVA